MSRRRSAGLRRARERGVAVVTALLLTTLAITIVASLFWQQQVQVRSIENQRLQLQKQWILRGALDWARLILREDYRFSPNIDSLDEPWAVPLEQTRLDQYLEEGQTAEGDAANATLSGSIVDAQSHYNLRNLVVNGAVNALEVAGFERLLASLRLDPALAQATASMMLVSEPKTMNTASSGTQSSSTGTQSSSTATQTQSSVTQATTGTNGQSLRLLQVDDLLAVPGFTPEAVEKLRDFVIFLPRPTPVNINTAPAEVLAAKIDKLSTADAAALVAARKIASFRDLGDVRNRMAGRDLAISASQISFSTGYFLVNGNVSMRRAGLDVQALIERNGLTTRLVWVREK